MPIDRAASRIILLLVTGIMSQIAQPAALAQLSPNATDAGVRPSGSLHAGRSLSLAMHGMAATSHALATQIALDILKKGGSAVDAAIAANAMLGFAEPMMCGPGGDLFAIVWDPASKKLHGLNGSGRSPRALSRPALQDLIGPDATRMPFAGPLSVTVPGAVDAWFELHDRFGRLPMRDILSPSIAYAREGVPTPEVIAHEWQRGVDFLQRTQASDLLSNLTSLYLPGGHAPSKGELYRNPALADFLERLARDGRNYFYRGAGAARISAYLARVGGHLTEEDFAAHQSTWVEPVSVNYRGYDIVELPPNGQGIAALQMLNILEGFDLAKLGRGSADFWHLMIEAKKLAFEDRARHYADPEYMRMPITRLLSKDYATERRKLIDMQSAMLSAEAGAEAIETGDTVYLAVADGEGMMVSLIQSIAGAFGSGLVPDGLGFALQNRGAGFALESGHPNEYAPGKRPFHTIIPAFVMKDGEPLIAFGLMGGSMQPQGHAQIVVNLIDFDMDLQAAGDAARFRHEGSSGPGTTMRDGGHVIIEPGIPPQVLEDLRRRGHRVELARDDFGGYEAVSRDPRTRVLAGATELRKDGSAAGY
jgi:gamma-glutamyltranspeptidase/glutathione hydrolase